MGERPQSPKGFKFYYTTKTKIVKHSNEKTYHMLYIPVTITKLLEIGKEDLLHFFVNVDRREMLIRIETPSNAT
jgi:hypothetical protein